MHISEKQHTLDKHTWDISESFQKCHVGYACPTPKLTVEQYRQSWQVAVTLPIIHIVAY